MSGLVRPNERVDDLQRNGLQIIQNPEAFCFGMDAVLLADFARLHPRDRVADLGTGTGILPLLMSQKEPDATFEAFELQPDMADMARRSVLLNALEERIHVYAADMREAAAILGRGSMNAVVCNPPYGKRGCELPSEKETVQVARHETEIDIGGVAMACAAVLRNRGLVSMAFPAPRMLELCDALRRAHLEPKRARMVSTKLDRAPYLLLLEAMKGVNPGLRWLPPLMVCGPDGSVTEEIRRIYHRA